MPTINYSTTLVTMSCGKCGIPFAVPQNVQENWRESGHQFYCPNGHPRVYRESTVDTLRREIRSKDGAINTLNRRNERLSSELGHTERQCRAYKGHLTKTKKRIAGGACPCCNRSFQNLHRHMKSQHPDYVEIGESNVNGTSETT